MRTLIIETSEKRQIIDITKIINDFLIKNLYERGLVNITVNHTTCAVTTADLDPGTSQDYLSALEAMFPKLTYVHPHNPGHFGDHFLSTLIGTSLSIPVSSASMVLGTYQKVVLIELSGPKKRSVVVTFIEEKK